MRQTETRSEPSHRYGLPTKRAPTPGRWRKNPPRRSQHGHCPDHSPTHPTT